MNPYSPPALTNPYAPSAYEAPPAGGYGATPGVTADAPAVSDASVEMLRQTRPWVIFMSVLAFIGAAFSLLAGFAMLMAGALGNAATTSPSPIPIAALSAVYFPFAAIYVYPGIKLWSFGSAIGRLVTSRSTFDLEGALRQQKSFWKYCGIVSIATILLYMVFIVAMIGIGISAASHAH